MKKIRNTKFFMLNGILTLLLFVVLMLLLVTVVPYKVANADSSSNVIDEKSTMTQQDDIIYNASGWIPETLQIKLSVPLLSIVDESVSTTEKVVDYTNAFPTPGNQGTQSSCTAWAVGYAAKSYLVNVGQKWGIDKYQFSPSYIYNQLNGGKNEGISIYDAMNLVIDQGVCLLSDMPYSQDDYLTQPTQSQRVLASSYQSLSMRRVADGSIEDMKAILNSGIPIVIGFPVYPDFDELDRSNPIYDTVAGESRGNHAVCLIGYDDNSDAFKIINSWGTSWGLDGYGYIAYSLLESFKTTGWVLYDAKCGQFANSEFSGTELTQYVPINDSESSVVIIDGITKIGNSAFKDCVGIDTIKLSKTVTSIGDEAFSGCNDLKTILSTDQVTSIGNRAFEDCIALLNFIIPSGVTYIGDGAFAGCDNLNITVSTSNPNYSAANNILYNKNKTQILAAGNVAPVINIPDTVTDVLPSAFENNSKVTTLHFEGGTEIGEYAFADCENLDSVYFYTYTVPEIGENAFLNGHFTLYVPHSRQSVYNSVFAGYGPDIDSIQVTVTFVSGDTVVDTQIVYFGATINALGTAYKTGYDFCGWYDNPNYTGTAYEIGGLWDTTEDLTLYADLQPKEFYITFSGFGSEGLSDKLVVYDSLIGELPEPERVGYTFLGWKDEYNTVYTADMLWQQLGNIAVTSAWSVNEYTITYDGNNGTASVAEQSVEYGSVIASLATATRDGYVFTGWNISADGSGQTVGAPYEYLFDYGITLYAQYTPKEYVVTFDKQGGTGGTVGVDAVFDEDMPEGTDITAPTKTGYVFSGYYWEDEEEERQYYYNSDMTSANKWDIDEDTTIFAAWTPNTYVVKLNKQGGTGGPESITVTYNASMPTGIAAPSKEGYTFQGYYTQASGVGTKYYKQDMASANNWNATDVTEIYAYYTADVYTVILDRCGGTGGSSSVEATYGNPMPSAGAPTRTGYTFQGYYQFENGQGKKYYNSNMSSAEEWDRAENNCTLYAHWTGNQYTVTLDNGKYAANQTITVTYGSPMPTDGITVPTWKGHTFKGYFEFADGNGAKYYDGPSLTSVMDWNKTSDTTLYAHWEVIYYTVTLSYYNGNLTFRDNVKVAYGEQMPIPYPAARAPERPGYAFVGFFSQSNGKGTQYYKMDVLEDRSYDAVDAGTSGYYETIISCATWDYYGNRTLYANWEILKCDYTYNNIWLDHKVIGTSTISLTHGCKKSVEPTPYNGYAFQYFQRNGNQYTAEQTKDWTFDLMRSPTDGLIYPVHGFFAAYIEDTCLAEGCMITLADGTQKAVEKLTGNEMLLVWNLKTGKLDVAPILFIDSDPVAMYSVINLYFSDGTHVKVISEHGFWDYNLNKYVYLDKDAAQYIGHLFNKLSTDENGNSVSKKVQLINVVIQNEYTTAWSPVTYSHLCYYVNGMLSMPGGIEGLFNIFEVDAETMKYDEVQMPADIAQYGLFTYEEFVELFPVSEEVFEAFNGQYLKVAMGKGLIDAEGLQTLIERYAEFLSAIG